MASSYKFTYLPLRGVGETVRFLLSYGEIEFEDNRVLPDSEEWLKLKPKSPFGKLPILEINGKVAYQSIAIARYLAKQLKLTGKDDWEDMEIDAIVDTIHELGCKLADYAHEKDPVVKESLLEALLKDSVPYYFSRLEKIAIDNKGYLAVGRLTWADFFFASRFSTTPDLLKDYPNLSAVNEKVTSIPSVKAWIEKRPPSAY